MSRDLPAPLEDAIDAPVVRPFVAIRIELPDPVYVWTGRGNLIFEDSDGIERTWQGAGGLGSFETVGEGTDGSATGIRVTLFEVPSEFRDDIADQATRGAKLELYVGALNETYQEVEGVQLLQKARVGEYKITDNGPTLGVDITAESRAIDQRRPAIKRFTDEWQQRKYPGDKFFEFVPQMGEVAILWARAEQSAMGIGGSGGSRGREAASSSWSSR